MKNVFLRFVSRMDLAQFPAMNPKLTLEFQSTSDLLRALKSTPKGEQREAIIAELQRREAERPRNGRDTEVFQIPKFDYSLL